MKIIKGIFLYIFTNVLILSAFALLLIIPIRRCINNNVIKDMIYSLEIEQIVSSSPSLEKQFNESLEPIYNVTREVGIPDETVLKILNTKEVKELFGDITSNILVALITDENQKLVTSENIASIVATAIDDINEHNIIDINAEQKEKIVDVVSEKADEYQDLMIDTDTVLKDVDKEDLKFLDTFRFVLSNKMLMYLGIALAISLGGIIILRLKNAKWIKWCSLSILTAAILNIITNFIIMIVNNVKLKENYSFIYKIFNKIVNTGYLYSGIIIGIAIIVLIIYKLCKPKQIPKEA